MSILDLCINSDEPDIFKVDHFIEFLEFKWDSFSRFFYVLSFSMHLWYIGTLTIYVNEIYIQGNTEKKRFFGTVIILGIIYPACINFLEMYKKRLDYFKEL